MTLPIKVLTLGYHQLKIWESKGVWLNSKGGPHSYYLSVGILASSAFGPHACVSSQMLSRSLVCEANIRITFWTIFSWTIFSSMFSSSSSPLLGRTSTLALQVSLACFSTPQEAQRLHGPWNQWTVDLLSIGAARPSKILNLVHELSFQKDKSFAWMKKNADSKPTARETVEL